MLKRVVSMFTPFLVVFVVSISLAQEKKAKSSTAGVNDEKAIKALIEKETKSFFEIDQKNWANSWAHVPYAFWSFSDTTDVNAFAGWDDIYKGFDNYFRTSSPSTAKITRDWLHLRIEGNLAYVRFTQLVKDDNIRRPPQAEVRVLEKINGEWKIVCVSVIAIQKTSSPIR